MTLADRIAVLHDGHLQQLGTPAELYHNPANRFVAGFIGTPSMCFLEHFEKDAIVGLRPHDVQLSSEGMDATIEAVETMGFESYLHLSFRGEALRLRVEGEPPVCGATKIQLRNMYRFDKTSGVRIE